MIYTVEQIRHIATPIARSYGVKSLSLFGSYARGEAQVILPEPLPGEVWFLCSGRGH